MSGWKPVNTRLKTKAWLPEINRNKGGSSMRFAYNRRSSPYYIQTKKERMDIFVIGICSLLLLAIVAALTTKFARRKEGEPEVVMPASGDCSSCDGTDDKCEQVCMMEAATKEVEYYDDEELDRFRGRQSDQYTDKEAEEFAEVLYTMQPHEAKGWNRSLILRDINVPDQIKDELIAMIEG